MTPTWHRGAAAVATLTFDVDTETPILAQGAHYADHMMTMSHQSYGPDVGVPRILGMLDEVGVQATFFVPGWVAEHRPGLAAAIVERGHEVAHHSYSHRSPVTLTPAEERADFERALAVFAEQGIEIRGHRAALWGATWQTPSLIAEHGLAYDSSLMGDDRPYRMVTDTVPIVELPVHWSLDDWEQYAYLPDPHIGSVIESPVTGRILALRGFIEYALELGDVRFARCRDVAEDAGSDPTLAPRTVTRPAVTPDVYPD